MSEHTIRVTLAKDVGHINLRGNPDDDVFRKAVEAVLAQPLPVAPNTISAGDSQIFWLGPDEWLVTAPAATTVRSLQCLNESLVGCHAAVNDVSGGNIAIRLGGGSVRRLIAKGCTLDFHPDVFQVGSCAQSGLGKATALFGLIDDTPTFDLIVRRSFSGYLVKWLQHAGREYGIEFV